MYTQCPDCETIFHVTADQLSVANGDVRCGTCGATFNALFSLTDELPEPRPTDETRAYGEAKDAIRSGENLFETEMADRNEWLDLLAELPDDEVEKKEDSPETAGLPPWLGGTDGEARQDDYSRAGWRTFAEFSTFAPVHRRGGRSPSSSHSHRSTACRATR